MKSFLIPAKISLSVVLLFLLVLFGFLAEFLLSQVISIGDRGLYTDDIGSQPDLSFNTQVTRIIFFYLLNPIFGRFSCLFLGVLTFSIVIQFLRRFGSIRLCFYLYPFLFPSFWLWQLIPSKEALAIPVFTYLSLYIPCYFLEKRYSPYTIGSILLSLAFVYTIRPGFFPSYLILSLLYLWRSLQIRLVALRIPSFSTRHSIYIATVSVILLIIAILGGFVDAFIVPLMDTAKNYFTSYDSSSSRFNFSWSSSYDYVGNMFWGLPVSLIGFTPSEVWARPSFIPFFIEGGAFVLLSMVLLFKLINISSRSRELRLFVVYSFMPCCLVSLIIFYPFSIFNPGTSIRYKQNIAPIFLFVPLSSLIAQRSKELRSCAVSVRKD